MFFHVITRTLCFILDFQKRPLSYLIWRGTQDDLSRLRRSLGRLLA